MSITLLPCDEMGWVLRLWRSTIRKIKKIKIFGFKCWYFFFFLILGEAGSPHPRPSELKKINTSQQNQLKKLKKLALEGSRPKCNFFIFFNWFSWEVLNFFNSQRGQTACLGPLPASWPAGRPDPPDPGSGIVIFFIFLIFLIFLIGPGPPQN